MNAIRFSTGVFGAVVLVASCSGGSANTDAGPGSAGRAGGGSGGSTGSAGTTGAAGNAGAGGSAGNAGSGGTTGAGGRGGAAGSGSGGTTQAFSCGSTACTAGQSFCYSFIGGVPGSGTTRSCMNVPADCVNNPTCACICQPSSSAAVGCTFTGAFGAFCSCGESNGAVTVSCAGV